MKTVEERIQEYQKVMTPSELEGRLRQALEEVPSRRRRPARTKAWFAAAAAACLLTLGVYQYPAFAYYGGKLFNRSELHSLSFAELAGQGYGQAVNKSRTLKDGSVFMINGVIADDNALLVYYSVQRPSGYYFDDTGIIYYGLDSIEGFLTHSSPSGGSGNYSQDKTRFDGVYKFDPVSPFSRSLTLTLSARLTTGEVAQYPLSFKYDPNKAMRSMLAEDISQAVPVDQGELRYDTITASPTSTVVKGHYELENGEFPRFAGDTRLYVNGKELKLWEMRSSLVSGKKAFEIEFDVLPAGRIKTVELVLVNFSGYERVDQPISLAAPSDRSILAGPEKLWIRSVTRTAAGYDVVIARKQFTFPETESLAVQAGGKTVPVAAISPARPWDLKNGNILWEQTYSFNAADVPQFLLLEGYSYIKSYNKSITIPVGDK